MACARKRAKFGLGEPPAEKENALSRPRRSPADLAPGAGQLRTGTGKPPGAAGVARNYKFIGDGALAIFPVTGTTAEACEAALRAVVAARAGMAHLDAVRQAQGLPPIARPAPPDYPPARPPTPEASTRSSLRATIVSTVTGVAAARTFSLTASDRIGVDTSRGRWIASRRHSCNRTAPGTAARQTICRDRGSRRGAPGAWCGRS
jgi:hypothetical protein